MKWSCICGKNQKNEFTAIDELLNHKCKGSEQQ